MTVPSRCMPSYRESLSWRSKLYGFLFIGTVVSSLLYLLWTEPDFRLFVLAFIAVVLFTFFFYPDETEHLKRLQRERRGEDIGTFARALDYRKIDSWIIRAVYEEINDELPLETPLPLRPMDRLKEDLKLDEEELEFALDRIFVRVGLGEDKIEENPYYGKIETVEDLVHFCNHQPCLPSRRTASCKEKRKRLYS